MKISARNQIEGTVAPVKEGAVNGHVTIEDADGVRTSSSIANESIESLGVKEGGKAPASPRPPTSWSPSASEARADTFAPPRGPAPLPAPVPFVVRHQMSRAVEVIPTVP